jgi:ABC-type polysaccharide/polyol phosphate transport system ATPase subunit
MQARLGCALIQASDPSVLLLDEVHEALDHEFRGVLREFAAGLLARGGIVVAAGHDHELASRVCGRALLIANGGVHADGAFDDVHALLEDEPTVVR